MGEGSIDDGRACVRGKEQERVKGARLHAGKESGYRKDGIGGRSGEGGKEW